MALRSGELSCNINKPHPSTSSHIRDPEAAFSLAVERDARVKKITELLLPKVVLDIESVIMSALRLKPFNLYREGEKAIGILPK